MGRGLSQQQREILELLPWAKDVSEAGDAPSTRQILGLLNIEPTPSNRASVSRSVSRLHQRGLILHKWGFSRGRQHTGYMRATPADVEERNRAKAAFLARGAQAPTAISPRLA